MPANGNTVTINALDVTVTSEYGSISVFGGYTPSDAKENTIAIKSGTFNSKSGRINGGYSTLYTTDKTDLTDNAVNITGGKFNGNYTIEGAHGESYGGTLNIKGNSVTIEGRSIPMDVAGWTYIRGGYARSSNSNAEATVENNTVKITGGTFATATNSAMEIAGGNILATAGAKGDVKNNTVEVTGGTFKGKIDIYGGYENSSDDAIPGTATGNTVKVNGGTFAKNTRIAGGSSYEGAAENNKVYLSGGEFSADAENLVIGGMSETEDAVMNNTVYVYGNVDLANVELVAATDASANLIKSGGGNTLVFGYIDDHNKAHPWMSSTGKVSGIYGFDTIKITAATWNKPIITNKLNATYANEGNTTVDATKVAFSGVKDVKKGDKTVLLQVNEMGEGSGLKLKDTTSKYTIGTTLIGGDGTVSIEGDGYEVAYTIDSVQAQAQTHTAAMGMTAGVAALNQGADTVLATLKNLSNSGHTGLEAFGAMGGGTARQETGSHLTLNAFNFATGLGSNIDVGAGTFTVGGALEAGYGSFKNHFDAGEADPFVKKSGHLHYYGGAATAGMKWNSLWHTDGLFRLGYAKSEQGSGLYNPGLGTTYDVDIGSYYVGTEVGGGKAFKLDDMNAIDVYARYFWLHKGGDDFYAGGEYDLKSVDSHRLRTGARYDLSLGSKWGFYAGLAYEYEFDGKSRLIVDGVEAEAVKTKGGRAYGELGVKLTPEKDAAGLSLDFNVKGAAGSKYRDVLFGVDVKYMF